MQLNPKVRNSVIDKMTDFVKLIKEIRKQTQGRPEYEIIKEELQRTAGANERVMGSDDEEDEVV